MDFQRLASGPTPNRGSREPTPPDLIEKSDNPFRVLTGEADKPITPGLLLGIVGVWAGHPQFGPSPLYAHSLQCLPDGFLTDLTVRNPDFGAKVGQELERPGTSLLPEVAWTLVDQFL